jgi:hypothetical protein
MQNAPISLSSSLNLSLLTPRINPEPVSRTSQDSAMASPNVSISCLDTTSSVEFSCHLQESPTTDVAVINADNHTCRPSLSPTRFDREYECPAVLSLEQQQQIQQTLRNYSIVRSPICGTEAG